MNFPFYQSSDLNTIEIYSIILEKLNKFDEALIKIDFGLKLKQLNFNLIFRKIQILMKLNYFEKTILEIDNIIHSNNQISLISSSTLILTLKIIYDLNLIKSFCLIKLKKFLEAENLLNSIYFNHKKIEIIVLLIECFKNQNKFDELILFLSIQLKIF